MIKKLYICHYFLSLSTLPAHSLSFLSHLSPLATLIDAKQIMEEPTILQ
ncbi:hypothetical protein RchiOBHm_Chr5g0001081 [Rosa chinensis]|uniref:Uncharacterized protein n=1 Tax=Rosa chinensis TaxID=74649 RepID=A0A2P6Q255_ROSCH|nr:hypothetical protein RchiOBHm_Chr5g0001081 [Rosa chinensis]